MEKRIGVVGIVIENADITSKINSILHDHAELIIGRMGIRNIRDSINVISVIVDAPHSEISALTGKLGMIKDVSCKAVYSKI